MREFVSCLLNVVKLITPRALAALRKYLCLLGAARLVVSGRAGSAQRWRSLSRTVIVRSGLLPVASMAVNGRRRQTATDSQQQRPLGSHASLCGAEGRHKGTFNPIAIACARRDFKLARAWF